MKHTGILECTSAMMPFELVVIMVYEYIYTNKFNTSSNYLFLIIMSKQTCHHKQFVRI
ncbi:unnamed protein product [Schistosoma curassoni]|uniref:Uncharacterized protein n=1 Tax=Schistosoma curassoni TaxID=6186 RepID=A0A183KT09_9TREM|nr:unnamed protein product [Schistosoma curassoni]